MKEIQLNHGQAALVDDDDYEELRRYRWSALPRQSGGYYAHRSSGGRVIYMHRVLAGAHGGEIVDHINHQTLDNRRANLRRCTNAQNQANRQKGTGYTSRYKGVSWNTKQACWVAFIKVDRKSQCLGVFSDEESAAAAYDVAARKLFGEFACLNNVVSNDISPRRPSRRRLSTDDMRDIICALETLPVGQRQLARAYGVSSSVINRIALGQASVKP